MDDQVLNKAALRGEPSYVWRDGQIRRLQMIEAAASERIMGTILDNGCGIGLYSQHLRRKGNLVAGLEFDFERATRARQLGISTVSAVGEGLPFTNEVFDLIVSHEVLEHVQDDRLAVVEMVRVLKAGGRLVLFTPNRGYPFETHGIFWRGKYHFGNIPFINYLPRILRDKLAPHVKVYTSSDIARLFQGLPVQVVNRNIIFGAYDNIINRFPRAGRVIRGILQRMEHTPLRVLGLSHFWVVEKIKE